MDGFDPWRDLAKLPEHAPVRRLRPDELPRGPAVRARLAAEGIDPDNAGAIIAAIFRRGWTFWLIGTPRAGARFVAVVLEPQYGAAWAEGRGETPAEALGAVLVACLDAPPWGTTAEERASEGTEGS